MKFDATREKTRLWLLLLVGVVATLLGQTHAREIFAPSPHGSGIFATQTQASTGEIYDVCRYDAPDSLLAANKAPELGRKLEYLLGNATGNAHNVERSTGMLRQLQSVGLHDNPATRQYLTEHLGGVVNNASNIVRTQANGAVVRESLLMGPNGGMKFETKLQQTPIIRNLLAWLILL